MNCRRVQKLIPLHVEGDLRTGVAARVESHLEWCGRCNWLADEYKESQKWLRTSQPLELDERFLEDFKTGVMNRVAAQDSRPSLFGYLVQHWNRRQTLALAASLVLVIGMIALYFYQGRRTGSVELISNVVDPPSVEEIKPREQPKGKDATGMAPGAHSIKQRATEIRTRLRSLSRHREDLTHGTARAVASQRRGTTEPVNAIPDRTSSQTGIANSSRDLLRIEIQTGDPSIRIIWFAPKETDLHQSKPATD